MSTPPLPKGMPDTEVHVTANQLHSAAIHLLRAARVADLETGLSPTRLSLLSILVYAGPQPLGRLAELEQVSRPAISRTAAALVDEGLIRTRRGKDDRRSVIAEATPAGRRLMEAGRRRRLEQISTTLAGLSRSQLAVLREATEILSGSDETSD